MEAYCENMLRVQNIRNYAAKCIQMF